MQPTPPNYWSLQNWSCFSFIDFKKQFYPISGKSSNIIDSFLWYKFPRAMFYGFLAGFFLNKQTTEVANDLQISRIYEVLRKRIFLCGVGMIGGAMHFPDILLAVIFSRGAMLGAAAREAIRNRDNPINSTS